MPHGGSFFVDLFSTGGAAGAEHDAAPRPFSSATSRSLSREQASEFVFSCSAQGLFGTRNVGTTSTGSTRHQSGQYLLKHSAVGAGAGGAGAVLATSTAASAALLTNEYYPGGVDPNARRNNKRRRKLFGSASASTSTGAEDTSDALSTSSEGEGGEGSTVSSDASDEENDDDSVQGGQGEDHGAAGTKRSSLLAKVELKTGPPTAQAQARKQNSWMPKTLLCFGLVDLGSMAILALAPTLPCEAALRHWLLGSVCFGFPVSYTIAKAATLGRKSYMRYRITVTKIGQPKISNAKKGEAVAGANEKKDGGRLDFDFYLRDAHGWNWSDRIMASAIRKRGSVREMCFDRPIPFSRYFLRRRRDAPYPLAWRIEAKPDGEAADWILLDEQLQEQPLKKEAAAASN
eukprot:CAMPEP_0179000124 /NCGR_PEP_ID=MMETSP0795-20121207/10480_1 /TAXON_ID=88552 /ORGANISM="Amoebophrya sp., Strain Ameob2" /LENGTH=402 /DNA_ID=CAMNT_0020693051 /DNA_START=37 /DNA_END=1242 /DNA_ORIENTATION=-